MKLSTALATLALLAAGTVASANGSNLASGPGAVVSNPSTSQGNFDPSSTGRNRSGGKAACVNAECFSS